jgi:hypothetical protein
MDSILESVKQSMGPSEGDNHFDPDIIMHINTALMSLNQLGVGPAEGFSIFDGEAKWQDLLGTRKDLEAVKSFVYLKTRLAFDPPQSGFLVDAIKSQITELEFRINLQVEGGITNG